MRYLHTMVRARDLDETLAFYCDKLGLEEVNRHESEKGRFTLVFLAAPEDVELARSALHHCWKSPGTGTRRITTADETSVISPFAWTISTPPASGCWTAV